MAISKITENGLTITDLTVADDLTVSDDLLLASDGAILKFGTDADVTLTHVHNTGLTLNDALTTNDNITISEANPELFLAATGDGGEGSIGFKDDDGNIDGKIAYRTDYSGQTDNYMTFNTNGSNERMRIDDSGNVAIGNTSPSSQYMTRLVVGDGSGTEGITVYSGNDSQGRLEFSDATSGDGRFAGGIVYNHSTNKLRFNTNGGNERLGIDSGGDVTINAGDLIFGTSGKGINLGVTSNTDSNTLDDYEEGTHTVTMAAATSGSITMKSANNTAHYVKVGKLVTVSGDIRVDSVSSPSGSITMSLPFAVSSSSRFVSSIITHGIAKQTNQLGAFFLQAVASSSTAVISFNKDNATNTSISGTIAANNEFKITLTYQASA